MLVMVTTVLDNQPPPSSLCNPGNLGDPSLSSGHLCIVRDPLAGVDRALCQNTRWIVSLCLCLLVCFFLLPFLPQPTPPIFTPTLAPPPVETQAPSSPKLGGGKEKEGKKQPPAPKKSLLDTILPSWLKPKNQVIGRK